MARRRRNPEIIAGRVNADGSIAAASGDFTVTKAGTGLYTINFGGGFRLAGVTYSPYNANNTLAYTVVNTMTERSVQVQMAAASTGNAATDASFTFTAVGVQQ